MDRLEAMTILLAAVDTGVSLPPAATSAFPWRRSVVGLRSWRST
jgi:hypothetical protein